MRKFVYILLFIGLLAVPLWASKSISKHNPIQKTTVVSDARININRMNGIMRNNGTWFYDNILSDWGLEWPQGSGISPIFAAGQWIGAMVNGSPRIAGVIHDASEFQAGVINTMNVEPPVAANRTDSRFRWYELRSDGTGDWNNWPVDQGAPVDANGKPALLGDQMLFSVWNDLNDHALFSTQKLGVEVRQLVWAYNRADAIGDMVFVKWQMINKSANDWDESYFLIWSDPDDGNGRDDFVGCDTTLGLGFCYNATNNDQNYGAAPPAVGIDFFQGPLIDSPGDTAKFPDGSVFPNKKLLKMTSFVYYNNDDSPQGNPQTGGDAWNYMRGYWRDGTAITYGGTGTIPNAPRTSFMFSGDPETASGWLDSHESDRRFIMATGPYRMDKWTDPNGNGIPERGEPGVQEIVAGVLVGRGATNVNSVTYLKAIDEIAQLTYDINFALPRPPKSPMVQVSQLDNEVILSWNERSEFLDDGVSPYQVADIVANGLIGQNMVVDGEYKEVTDGTYDFTGYTVYQYSDASGRNPIVYANLGVDRLADMTPYSDARFIRLTINRNPAVGNVGDPLHNGKTYYFGVQANSYCKFAIPQVFPSSATIVSVTPQKKPGVRYTANFNDSLVVNHVVADPTKRLSDGRALAWVVDPSKATGLDYTVTFNADLTWNLLNSRGDSLIKKCSNQSGNDAYNVVDGLLVKVMGPQPGINLTIPGPFGDDPTCNGIAFVNNAVRWVSWPYDWGLETGFGSIGNGFSFFGSTLTAAEYVNVSVQFAGCTDRADLTAAGLAAKSKVEFPDRWSKGVVYRRDLGYGVQTQLADIPVAVWDTENNRRLKVAIVEDANAGSGNFLWDMGWDGSAFRDRGGREYLFILNDTYDENYTDYLNGTKDGTGRNAGAAPAPVLYAAGFGARGSHPYLEGAFDIQIIASHVNTVSDRFTFKAPTLAAVSAQFLKEDLKTINVVPNPYYGYHSGELNIFARWIQFTSLPAKCTVRVFDLAGSLVRRLDKDDATTTLMQWDLKNSYQLPVASGIYVYHVEVPGVGEKIGKIAIFTPNERLDTY